MDIDVQEKLEKLYCNGIFNNREIVLFGANKSSQEMCEYLLKKNCQVVAIVDNNSKKWNQKPFGVMTYKPEDFLNPYNKKYVILIVSQYANEMTSQLEQMGYELNKQIYIVKKLFRKYDTSIESFKYFEDRIVKGEAIYKRVSNGNKLFICPYVGNGDIYLIGQFLTPYCKKNGIENYDITVIGNACKKIAEMFEWKCVHVLNQDESDELVAYVRFMGLAECNAIILNDCYQQPINRRFRGYKGLDFYKIFQQLVFGFDENERYVNQENKADLSDLQKYVEEYDIQEGTSVIFAPYANTITKIPVAEWEKMVREYKEKGYKTYTNGFGEAEPAINGTELIQVPFNIIKEVVSYAGTFVGLRSGLCDIVAGSTARKIIYYPQGILFGSCSTYDYFSIEKMGIENGEIEESEY